MTKKVIKIKLELGNTKKKNQKWKQPSWKKLKTKAESILVDADSNEVERLKKGIKIKEDFIILNVPISDKKGFLNLNILNNPAMSGSKKRVESTSLFKSEAIWLLEKNK